MPSLAHIADIHIDHCNRFDECKRVLTWTAEDIARRKPDLVLIAGDVFERASTPEERLVAAAFVRRLAEVAPVVLIRGNHDKPGDLLLLAQLANHKGIAVIETIGVVEAGGVVIGCLAWPSKAGIIAAAESYGHRDALAADALRAVLRGLGVEMERRAWQQMVNKPRVLMAHAMVRGSKVSTGQTLVGCDFELGLEDLALAEADYVALGHIHLEQEWDYGTVPIVYPGSTRRANYGEPETKGYALAHFNDENRATWEFIETPCTPMVLVEDTWIRICDASALTEYGAWMHDAAEVVDPEGAEIRLRYRVAAHLREEAAASAERIRQRLYIEGAHDVKIEEVVISTGTARAPEVAAAPTLAAKLDVYWRTKQSDMSAERKARLLSKVADLEAEHGQV